MINSKTTFLPVLLGAALVGLTASSLSTKADASANAPLPRMYEVTITNLTSNQVISPPILVTHDGSASLFEAGTAASPELAALAEDGDNCGLAATLGATSGVLDIVTAAGGIAPGTSMTLTIEADYAHRWFSCAGMLVTTNDAFTGVNSIVLIVIRAFTGGRFQGGRFALILLAVVVCTAVLGVLTFLSTWFQGSG